MGNLTPITKFIAIDLEMNQPSQKIIQIGVVVGDIETKEILAKVSIFINPHESLSNYIMALTGIKQEDVDGGIDICSAYLLIKTLSEKHGCFINPITWGGGDSEYLRIQLNEWCDKNQIKVPPWCFGRRWIDTKTLFVSMRFANKQPIQGGLARSMTKLGLKFKGKKHNAADDAENTFFTYCALLDKLLEQVK